jgi:hypothetical protein
MNGNKPKVTIVNVKRGFHDAIENFAEACIANDDNFNDVIFTDECSVQLHGNKIAVYRLKDSVAPLIPMPKRVLWNIILL